MAKSALSDLQDQIEAVRREAFAEGYAAAMQAVRALAAQPGPAGGSTQPASATPAAASLSQQQQPARPRMPPQRGAGTGSSGGRASAAPAAAAAAAAAPRRRPGRPRATVPVTAAATPRARGAAVPRPQRGTNARYVEEVLQASAPRALRPAEIRSTVQREKGVALAFTSIRHALGQLETRRAIEQVGDSKTWRHIGGSGGTG